jgi:peptide/nickel transport system permease protein
MLVAIAFGLYGAVKAGTFADRFLTTIAVIGISMPVFWVGALMNHYLGFKLGIFPNGGYVELTKDPVDWAYHLILPWTALAILFIGLYAHAAFQLARHRGRGLRAHGAREEPGRARS